MTSHGVLAPLPTRRAEPFGLPRTFWALWAAVLVNRLATFVQPFLVVFLVRDKGMPVAQAGLVATLLGVGAVASSLLGGRLGDRLERRRAVIVGDIASAAALLALAAAPAGPLVWVTALAVGLASDLSRPAAGALVADLVGEARRVRAYSMNFWALNLGFSVATASAGVLGRWGLSWLFVIDAGATLLSALVVRLLVPRVPRATRPDGPEHAARGVLAAICQDPRAVALVVAATAYAVVYQQAYSTLPLVMARDGLSTGTYGAVVSVNGLVIVLLQPVAARLLELLPHDRVYVVSLLVVAAGFGATLLATSVAGHVAVVVLWSIGEVGSAAVVSSLFVGLAPKHQRAGFLAVFSLTFSVGMAVGPALGTWVLATCGEPALWLGCTALLSVAAVPLALRRRPGRAPAVNPG